MKLLSHRQPVAIFFVLTLLTGVGAQTPTRFVTGKNSGQAGTQYVDRQVIVKLADNVNTSAIDAARSSMNAKVLKRFSSIGAELWQISDETVDAAMARYRRDPRIKYVEPNYRVSLIQQRIERFPNDPRFSLMWGLHNTGQTGGTNDADVDAPEAWDIETGDSVVIGVIDTGIDWQHEDLAGNVWTNPGEIPNNGIDDDRNNYVDDVRGWDFVNNDNDPMDDEGHGSHVSGTIAAVGNNGVGTVGVSWSAKIMPLKFLDASGSGTTADAILAVEYATRMRARLTSNSWGGDGFSQALYDAIAAAGRAGILFVAAAGNDGGNNDLVPHYPSNYDLDNIISVAATDHNDRLASFSNFGATSVDLGAPGVNILSTFPGDTYGTISGTSMATPHVSGAISLVWSRVPGLTHLQVKDLILRNVDPIPALQGRSVSGGRLNAFKALLAAEPDSIAPAAVTDLAATDPKSNFMTLTWTTSGDDGDSGKATAYDIRYSTSPINSANFAAANTVSGAPAPKPAGEPERFAVGGLNFNTTYYFALKVLDEQGNASAVSNSPSGTTLGVPEIAVTPDSLADSLLTGAKSTRALTISNAGEGTLDFKIAVEGEIANRISVSLSSGSLQHYAGTSGITEFAPPDRLPDDRIGSMVGTTAASLPFYDGFEDGDFKGWIDDGGAGIKEVTTATAAKGKHSFHYQYAGTAAHSHGIHQEFNAGSQPEEISFYIRSGSTTAADAYTVFYGNGGITLVMYFFASNTGFFNINGTDSYAYNPLQWYHVGFKDINWTDKTFDCYIDGRLISANIPFRNAGIVNSVDRLYLYNFHTNSEAWWDEINVGSATVPADWLAATPDSGSVFAGSPLDIDVTFDATGLNGGDYAANLAISSNDPNNATVKIPARLHVTGAPDIALSDSVFDFGARIIGDTATAKLTVSNLGTDALAITRMASDNGDFTAAPDTFTLNPDGRREVLVRFIPSTEGNIAGTLTITTNDPDEPVVTVALRGRGVLPPEIAVAPDSLRENLLTGQTSKQLLTIANTGLSDLSFEIAIENINVIIPLSAKLKNKALAGNAAEEKIASAEKPAAPIIAKGARTRDAGWTLRILRANERVAAAVSAPLTETNSAPAAAAAALASADEVWRQRRQNPLSDTAQVYAVVLDGVGTSDPGARMWDELNANWPRFGDRPILIDYSTFHAVEITYAGLAASGADAVIISNNWNPTQSYGPFSEAEAQAVAQYVNEGAGLYISGGTFNNGIYPELQFQVTYLAPLVGLSAAERYFWNGGVYGSLNFIVPDHLVLRNISAPFTNGWQFDTLVPASGAWTAAAIPTGTLVGISNNQQTVLVVNGNRVYHSSLPDHATGTEADKQFLYNAITLSGGASWVSANPLTGTVAPNSQAEIEVAFDATGLKGGDYTADLVVANNDPDEKRTVVPVHLQVTDAADIAVTRDTLKFGQVFIGATASLKLPVQNKGTLDLLIFSAVADPAVYTVKPPFAGIDPGEQEVFTVRFSPKAAADYPGTLTFKSNDPDEPAYVVTLLGQGVTPPDIAVSPASFAFNLNAGDTAKAVMSIANSGGSALDFTIRDEETQAASIGGQKLYWTETFDVAPDTIHRSNLNGTGIEKLLINQTDPLGIAVDEQGGRIYWTEFATGSISSSRLDGSDAKTLVSNLPSPVDLALDPVGGKMYWTDYNSGTISRANLDGSGITIIVQSLGAALKNVSGPKDKAPSTHTPIVRSDENALVLFNPWGIALDLVHGKVYWSEQVGDRIGRANLDGSGLETIIASGINGPRGLKLDAAAGKIYFVDSFNDAIKRANLDGSSVETILQFASDRNTLDLELDIGAKQFYWSDNSVHLIQRANFDGSNLTSIISDSTAPAYEGFFGVGLLSGTNWLTERPTSGKIAADSTGAIDLKVDTKGLRDGDYRATIFVASNDPDEREVPVPVTLHVTGVPEIAVSRDTLDYGAIFIGASVIDTLIVSNVGTAPLSVTDIAADLPQITVNPAKFDLDPEKQQTVVVTFKPDTAQEFSGQLTITSNASKRPTVIVALLGKGTIPPHIAVAPDSLHADLLTGQTETKILTISNNGGSDLTFNISIENAAVESIAQQTPSPNSSRPISARLPSHTKAELMASSNFPAWREWPKRSKARPAPAKFQFARTALAALLPVVVKDSTGDGGPVDVTVLRGASGTNDLQIEIEFATIIDRFNFGGILALDVDQDPATGVPPLFGISEQDIGSEYIFSFFPLGDSGAVDLFNAVSFEYIASYPVEVTPHTLRFSARLADLGKDDGNMDVTGVLGTSAGPTDWFPDVGHGTIRAGASWLFATPVSGVVPPGASAEINVTFNATGLQGGDYFAQLAIANNDPDSSRIIVPAHLHVTGAPAIAVSDSVLDFGSLFVGASVIDTLLVCNKGTDTLKVSGIASDNGDFAVSPTQFDLAPEECRGVEVTFKPSQPGIVAGRLTITSNDPDEGTLTVALQGKGLIAPDIDVTPPAFIFKVPKDGHAAGTMKIANTAQTGAEALNWSLFEQQVSLTLSDGRTIPVTVSQRELPQSPTKGNLDGREGNSFDPTDPPYTHQASGLPPNWGIAKVGDIVGSIPFPPGTATINGLAWGNGRLWATDFNNSRILEMDGKTGAIISSFSAPGGISPSELAHDGRNLWHFDFSTRLIYKIDPKTGKMLTSFQAPFGMDEGLDSDGTYLWGGGSTAITKFDSTGKVIAVISGPGPNIFCDGLAWDGSTLWYNVTGSSGGDVLQIDPSNGAVLQRFKAPAFNNGNGLAFDGLYLRYDDSTADSIFSIDIEADACSWLIENPTSGVTPADGGTDVELRVNAAGLAAGTYKCNLKIASNDPDESVIDAPVTLHVALPELAIAISDSLLGVPGETVEVPVYLTLNEDSLAVAALGAAIKATNKILTYIDFTPGPIIPDTSLRVISPTPDSVRLAFLAANGKNISQSGLLATLRFKIANNAPAGQTALFNFNLLTAADSSAKPLSFSADNGMLKVNKAPALSGRVQYAGAGAAKPAANLTAKLTQNGALVQETKTDAGGNYALANIIPGANYRVQVGRASGGIGAAITPTDALMALRASLSGAQKLAADVDGNLAVESKDATMIFDFFLGLISQFPVEAWRTFPANYNIDATPDAWKTAPDGIEYPSLRSDLTNQNYLAVVRGDVDLDWPPSAATSSQPLARLAESSAGHSDALLQFTATNAVVVAGAKTMTWQVRLDGDALQKGVYAFGVELRYDASALEITQVRWGKAVPAEGLQLKYQILPATPQTAADNSEAETLTGRLRFGGFSTASAAIREAGVLIEIEAQLRVDLAAGASLPIRFTEVSAAVGASPGLSKGNGAASFTNATITVADGAVQVVAIPTDFALQPNYPNPFNPATRIQYQLPEAATVKLEIFNALGQKVRTLVNGEQPAGYYKLEWNGRNDAEITVPSGVYFYRFEAKGAAKTFAKTRKMLMVK